MIQIIDNKKIDLTQDEWDLFQKICKENSSPFSKGEDLFKNLFESDNDGMIKFLKPPTTAKTSFQVFLFMMAIFQHQHIRKVYTEFDALKKEMTSELEKLKKANQ
jgi:hypothetical protein